MRFTTFGVAAALSAAVLVSAAAVQDDAAADRSDTLGVGDRLDPELTLQDIDGETHRFGDYQADEEEGREGKVVVVDFWSIQCPWSIKYEAVLKDIHRRFADQDVVFLAIDSNHTEVDEDADDPYARIRAYVEEAEVPYPILIDRGNRVADLFDAKTTPHAYVIDREGVIRYAGGVDDDPKGAKPKDEVEHWLADAIAAVVAGEEVEKAETRPFGCTIKRVPKAGQ